MRISRNGGTKMRVHINGTNLEQVAEYCYLGSMITEDNKCQREIRRRVAMGKEAFKKRNELLRGKLDLQLRKRMVKSLTWSVTLYASETWTRPMREAVKRLEAFDMWIWGRLKISWKEHITNE